MFLNNKAIVTAQAEDAQGRSYSLVVEFVQKVLGVNWLTQIVVKLPAELDNAGDGRVYINVRGTADNKALIKIK